MSGGWMEDGERTEVEEEIIDGGERLEAQDGWTIEAYRYGENEASGERMRGGQRQVVRGWMEDRGEDG